LQSGMHGAGVIKIVLARRQKTVDPVHFEGPDLAGCPELTRKSTSKAIIEIPKLGTKYAHYQNGSYSLDSTVFLMLIRSVT
jgi:hypothetical protein